MRIVILVAAVFALNLQAEPQAGQKPKVVEAAKVVKQPLERRIKLIGKLAAEHEGHLLAEVSGTLEKIFVKDGASVKKGDRLAQIRNLELQRIFDLAQSRAALEKTQFERTKALFASGDVTQRQLDIAKAEWIASDSAATQAKDNLRKTVIVAPFSGTVGIFKAKPGSSIKIGDEIVRMTGGTQVSVHFAAPEDVLGHLSKGQEVVVLEKKGTITSIERTLDPETLMGRVKAQLGECEACVIGSSIDVELSEQTVQDALVLPKDAIFLKDKEPHVYLIQKNKVALTKVKTGLSNDTSVQITKGLKAGQRVVLRGQGRLYNGAEVTVKK